VKGCEYTISTWVWIWRSENKHEDNEFAIFRYYYEECRTASLRLA